MNIAWGNLLHDPSRFIGKPVELNFDVPVVCRNVAIVIGTTSDDLGITSRKSKKRRCMGLATPDLWRELQFNRALRLEVGRFLS